MLRIVTGVREGPTDRAPLVRTQHMVRPAGTG